MLTYAFVVFALSTSAFANIFVTAPIASTTMHGGQVSTITWMDDGHSPTLQSLGPAKVGIFVGNAQQQTQLQSITASVDVSTTSSIQFTPDPSMGPNSNQYFIRFESLSLKDANQSAYPAEAFSARFTMDSMTGTFSPAVESQISGQSTAPIGGSTASSPSATSATAKVTTSALSGTASKTGTAASSTPSKSGALGHPTTSAAAVVAVAALFGIALL